MAQPQSLLAELRALESRRSLAGLSADEERRLEELRAVVGGGAAAPRGFDVNAAAAALREPGVERSAPVLDVGALGPSTPPFSAELSEPDAVAPAAELAPLPGEDAGSPAGYELEAPPPEPTAAAASTEGYDVVPSFEAAGAGEVASQAPTDWSTWQEPGADSQAQPAAEGQWDPALAAQWEAYALAQGWDPNAPWDPEAVARQWDSFVRSMGWDPGAPQAQDPGAAPPADAGPAPALDSGAAPAEQPAAAGPWDAGATPAAAQPAAAAGLDPGAPAPADPDVTSGWDPDAVPDAEPSPEQPTAGVDAALAPVTSDTLPGWDPQAAAAPAAAEPLDLAEPYGDPALTARWRAEYLDTPAPARAAPASGSRRETDTASWDLSGPVIEPEAPSALTAVPDERDPGATAVWSLSDVSGTRPAIPSSWSDDPEPVQLDEMHLESGGSFGAADPGLPPLAIPELVPLPPVPAPPPLAWPPPAELETPPPPASSAEPMVVGDDQILEVGDDVTEVAEVTPAQPDDGEDLPVVEAVDVAEEPPVAAPPPGLLDLAIPLTPLPFAPPPQPEPPAAVLASPPPPAGVAPTTTTTVLAPLPPEPEPVPAPPTPASAAWAPPEQEPAVLAPPPARPGEPVGAAPQGPLEPPVRAFVPPPAEAAPWPASAPTPAPGGEPVPLESLAIEEGLLEAPGATSRVLPGLHRVVLHSDEGQVMRGLLQDPDLGAASLDFSAQVSGPPAELPAERVRAIFFMLSPGESAPAPSGVKVRVTFRDGRQVAGFSPDYDPDASGFFMIPADTRTNTARIWVYRAAVRQVSVS